ncbi:MAG TPA: N-acetyltransferase [Gammaproteobacteria bacterium]|nr:N-acetyltransferase [Gammaproteobacteria bacterium]
MSGDPIRFRFARSDDYPSICGLFTSAEELFRAFPTARWPFTLRQLHRITEQRTDLTVVSNRGEIIGFADLYDLVPRRQACIGNVIIKNTQRRQGTGKRLLEYMLDRIFNHHRLPTAMIAVFEDNRPAFRLYRQLGFTVVDRETRRRPDGREAVLLQMKLGAVTR